LLEKVLKPLKYCIKKGPKRGVSMHMKLKKGSLQMIFVFKLMTIGCGPFDFYCGNNCYAWVHRSRERVMVFPHAAYSLLIQQLGLNHLTQNHSWRSRLSIRLKWLRFHQETRVEDNYLITFSNVGTRTKSDSPMHFFQLFICIISAVG
jgi:hypothetical protein